VVFFVGNYEQPENVEQSYGQNILRSGRTAKIVSPIGSRYRQFDVASVARKFQKREDEPETNKEEKKAATQEQEEKKNYSAPAAAKSSQGIKNVFKGLAQGKKKMAAVETIVKVKKAKWILIGAAIFFGFVIVLAIGFTVLTGGGSSMTSMAFNEVSEYELTDDDKENYDEEYSDEYNEEYDEFEGQQ